MSFNVKLLLGYLLVINAVGFVMMGHDKRMAKRQGQRVPENRIFALAALGGAAGIFIAMEKFRHKTKHLAFKFGIPALLVVNMTCIFYILKTLTDLK